MLDVILYSRQQLIQERDAMASKQVGTVGWTKCGVYITPRSPALLQ
jgi:hypothetical protein